jgi:two-component system response regulator PilR (NtrC family)
MRILLVDDEVAIVEELGRFLSRRSHEVVGADRVAAALGALGSDGPFDVVLTDLRMPDGSGLDVVRACRDHPQPRPLALVMSGHAGRAEVAQARKDGALEFFPKPVSLPELLKTLAAIETSRQGSPDKPAPGVPAA